MTQLHSSRTANHRPYAGVYADATERLAATGFERALGGGVVPFAAEDLYKTALQIDNASEWVLTAITPTWVQVGGNGLTPAAHKTSHQLGGSDAIKLDDLAAPDDNTDLNVSTGAHGLTPKLNNSASSFLNGVGAWATPAGSGDVAGPASATDNAITRYDSTSGKLLQDSVVIVSDAGAITFPEIAAPSTPAAGTVHIYAKSDGKLYIKDDAGTETDLTAAGGGSIAPLVIEDANTVAQRNGATAQTFIVYKSFVSVTDYTRLKIESHSSGIALVADHLNQSSPNIIFKNTAGTDGVLVGNGVMWPTANQGFSLGGGSNRWNQVFSQQFLAYDTGTAGFLFNGGPYMHRTASGTMEIRDPSGAFNKIHLGLGQANVNVAFVKPASVQYVETRLGDESALAYHVSAGGKFTSAQFDKTNTTLADITGLTSEALTAGRTYGFEALLFVDADVVGGSKYAIAGTATATAIKYEIVFISDSANSMVITSRQTALGGSAGQAGTTAGICRISGTITVNAAGTLTVQFAQNAANGTSSVLTMSNLRVWQMN